MLKSFSFSTPKHTEIYLLDLRLNKIKILFILYYQYSATILENYGEQIFSNGFSADYGRYRSQLTTKKSHGL